MDHCHDLYEQFRERWPEIGDSPLHSDEIRSKKNRFRWLKDDDERCQGFLEDLEGVLVTMPILGIACVIDRPGYHRRYDEQYGTQKWSLCRTAFNICVERAAKYAGAHECRLNVFVERSDKKTDRAVAGYFQELKVAGQPFDHANSSRYAPMSSSDFSDVLYDFKLKTKQSRMLQIADLYLYPMCRGGYDETYRPYASLRSSRRLIDAHVDDRIGRGIKYYCFEHASQV
jgi:hypothetical protein